MKMRQALLVAILLISIPALVSCDLFGPSKEEIRQQQIKAYQQQLEAYQKAQDEYYKNLEKSLNEYYKSYTESQQNELQQKIQQVPGGEVATH